LATVSSISKGTLVGEGAEDEILVEDLDAGVGLDEVGGDIARALRGERMVLGSSPSRLTMRFLMLRTMSVTSSITPLMRAELVLDALDLDGDDRGALEEERSTRRRLLPTVVPKPRSKGSTGEAPNSRRWRTSDRR
jgi:hypothetical protein